MAKPLVVIVGRPNVGKSTLFNRMTGTHPAIVEDIPGVTRDRNYLDATWEGKTFRVVDTRGFYPDPPEDIFVQAQEQALFAVDEGDIIIHLLDGKDGITPADMELARMLSASGKQVLWAVNKIDAPTRQNRLYDFYVIGTEDLWPLSAATGYGYEEFMERLDELLPVSRVPNCVEVPLMGEEVLSRLERDLDKILLRLTEGDHLHLVLLRQFSKFFGDVFPHAGSFDNLRIGRNLNALYVFYESVRVFA